jgi:hypothetical protein
MGHSIDVDDILNSIDASLPGGAHTFIPAPRIQFTAHPFTAEELQEFVLAGEHTGLD